MANIQERRNKDGTLISYSIRVFRGRDADGNQLKPFTATFDVSPTWSEKSARKKAEAFAATFEEKCKNGLATDNRQTFQEYCEYVLTLKDRPDGISPTTLARYRDLTARVYPVIGHIKLKDLRPHHINDLYAKIRKEGNHIVRATAKPKLEDVIKNKRLGEEPAEEIADTAASNRRISNMMLGRAAKLSASTVAKIRAGETVTVNSAEALSRALGYPVKSLFSLEDRVEPYAEKTILEYHQLVSSVLSVAEKEMIVPYNAAKKSEKPTSDTKEAEFYEPEVIKQIKAAFDQEPLKWRLLGYILIYTGGRRGEALGLKWENIDFKNNRIRIVNNSVYLAEKGTFEKKPKTSKSVRWISVSDSVMSMLQEYKTWQDGEAERLIGYWEDHGYIFTQENGKPMHPDSINGKLRKIEKKYRLPHLHPHAFRHSYASALIDAGVDDVALSGSLGHSKPSTSKDIYGHFFSRAEEKNAAIISSAYDD